MILLFGENSYQYNDENGIQNKYPYLISIDHDILCELKDITSLLRREKEDKKEKQDRDIGKWFHVFCIDKAAILIFLHLRI